MRVVEESSDKDRVVAFVITGDGRTEQKVLKAIAKRYNGKGKALLFQKSSYSKKTGLNALKGVNEVHRLTGYSQFLILVDREHFSEFRLKKVLSETFGKYKITGQNPYTISTDKLRVHLVILGEKAAIEEHLAKLIELEHGQNLGYWDNDIKVLKSKIHTFIKVNGIGTYQNLIENAKIENIEESFKPLVDAIKSLEKA